MMKPLWEVRNLHKLLDGLSMTIVAVMLSYTILVFIAIPDIPGKLILLRVPAVSVICVIILLLLERWVKKSVNKTQKQIKLYTDLYVGVNVVTAIAYAFIQIDYLNTAKGIPGFSPITVPAIVAGLIVFFIYKFIEIRKAR